MTIVDVKAGTARHTFDLDHRTVEALRSWLTAGLEVAFAGLTVSDDETVFTGPGGRLTHSDYLSQGFDRHLATSDLPRIRFHDLRHAHATTLLKAGVHVKVVSEGLGHSSPTVTMTVYQRVIRGVQADAARLFCDALFGQD